MHSRFDNFVATDLGRQLDAVIREEQRYSEYAALSRAGVAAVTAIVHDLQKKFPEVERDQTARQFCGAAVADVMRDHGHEILQARGRVPGDTFTYGAVWTGEPVVAGFEAIVSSMAEVPRQVAEIIDPFPAEVHRDQPIESGFSLVEHVCHLRDLDADVYTDRLARIGREAAPHLQRVNGRQLAEERDYQSQEIDAALASFRKARAELVRKLSTTSDSDRGRWGLLDGIQRLTVDELAIDIHRHDETHLVELDELASALHDHD